MVLLRFIGAGGFNFVEYNYDTLDRVTQRDYYSAAPQRSTYNYNLANELDNMANTLVGVGSINRNYTYDQVSNRLTKSETLGSAVLTNFGYNNLYELTSTSGGQTNSYTYDAVGNRTNAN